MSRLRVGVWRPPSEHSVFSCPRRNAWQQPPPANSLVRYEKCGLAQPDASAEIEHGDRPKFDRLLNEGRHRLAISELNLPCQFTFVWSGIRFTAWVDKSKDCEHCRIQVSCDVCDLPFSAEDPLARARILTLVNWHKRDAACRFAIGPRGRVHCLGVVELDAAPQGDSVIVALTRHLLSIRPYLALASEQDVRRAARDAIRAEQ